MERNRANAMQRNNASYNSKFRNILTKTDNIKNKRRQFYKRVKAAKTGLHTKKIGKLGNQF